MSKSREDDKWFLVGSKNSSKSGHKNSYGGGYKDRTRSYSYPSKNGRLTGPPAMKKSESLSIKTQRRDNSYRWLQNRNSQSSSDEDSTLSTSSNGSEGPPSPQLRRPRSFSPKETANFAPMSYFNRTGRIRGRSRDRDSHSRSRSRSGGNHDAPSARPSGRDPDRSSSRGDVLSTRPSGRDWQANRLTVDAKHSFLREGDRQASRLTVDTKLCFVREGDQRPFDLRSKDRQAGRSLGTSNTSYSRTHRRTNSKELNTKVLHNKEALFQETMLLRRMLILVRQFKPIYYKLPKIIVNKFYSDPKIYDQADVLKRGVSYFEDVISKGVFQLLSKNVNIFDPRSVQGQRARWKDLIRQYDLDFFDYMKFGRISDEEKTGTEDNTKQLGADKANLAIINHQVDKLSSNYLYGHGNSSGSKYPLQVHKEYINGNYVLSEWRNRVEITSKQYIRAKYRYSKAGKGEWGLFTQYLFILALRYKTIGNSNMHCSIPPQIITKYKMGELFGSPFNTISDIYYSPFDDLEKKFGSQGNFFTSKIHPGVYLANPPFDTILVQVMFTRLMEAMKNTPGLTFLINIPRYHELKIEALDKYKTHLDNITEHPFFIKERILYKRKYMHYDYYSGKYIPVCNTKLILLSNLKKEDVLFTIKQIKKEWKEIVEKANPKTNSE